MIPKNITRQHIIAAVKKIDNEGVPAKRNSTKYSFIFNEKAYPPKYVISLANHYACGKELAPSGFNGGEEANSFLIDLGFNIQKKKQ